MRTQPESAPNNIGHFFMAIDPKAFRPEGAFEDDMDQLIDEMHHAAPSDPAQPVLVAGDPEALQREKRLREGIPLSAALADQLRAVCQRCGVPFVLG
jgi:LDH2 family malate/lactate/ureidoglycolate dehydrogenase